MKKAPRSVPAGEFKATCLALLDQVAETGQEVVVTKRGRAVARISPAKPEEVKSLLGSVLHEEDLIGPIGEEWDADR